MDRRIEMSELKQLKAVVLDWAGTTVDHGSRAPAIVFQAIFQQRGIDLTVAQAREPMGMAKREHIAAVAAMADVRSAWIEQYGSPFGESDIDAMYQEFLPLQKKTLYDHCEMIAGVVDAVTRCRQMGLKIGSSTGYTRELMEVVQESATRQGYTPDCVLCAEDAPRGRPAPYLLHEAAKRMEVYPMWSVVKVDDTSVGIEAGRNAGCWTVGVTRTGNGVGLSAAEVDQVDPAELTRRCDQAAEKLITAGAHFVIESVAELPELLVKIDAMMDAGTSPVHQGTIHPA
jgi:phosphonoacetaldehyde hydrolase